MAIPQNADRDQYLKFSRPRNNCLLCSAALNVDGRHASLINLADKEEAVRKDFCPTCWAKMREEGYFSFWVTKRVNEPSPEQRRLARSERNEALWRLFAALYESDSTELASQLFLLAHLLMKYKVLTFGGAQDGKLRFIHPKLEETFLIQDVAVDSVDFVSVKNAVEQQALAYAPPPEAGAVEAAAK
ncbi:hypothetical protein BH09SUM1_BH09SUM1_03160 [soil metagenome]